jgi:hypothetical protein
MVVQKSNIGHPTKIFIYRTMKSLLKEKKGYENQKVQVTHTDVMFVSFCCRDFTYQMKMGVKKGTRALKAIGYSCSYKNHIFELLSLYFAGDFFSNPFKKVFFKRKILFLSLEKVF